MGKIISLNISSKKGTVKQEVEEAKFIQNFGIEKDAHAGKWHRQVSLLSFESFESFRNLINVSLKNGVFGENLLVEGMDLQHANIGDQILIGDEIVLEITQIGKECHKGCEIRNLVGQCIMPQEGIFAKVIHGGIAKKGDRICFK